MRKKIKKLIYTDRFIVILGFIVVPILSFILIGISEESPLYTSISRIAWVHGHWFATFLWATVVMSAIVWLTYRMVYTGPLSQESRRKYFLLQLLNIVLVFIGCIIFPAKEGVETVKFVNYIHDYLTIVAWALYGIGLLVYSIIVRKKERFLGFLGIGLMSFTILSSLFFIRNVVDPASYVGASAVSEVYIINSLVIYLVVMYIAQSYVARIKKLGYETEKGDLL